MTITAEPKTRRFTREEYYKMYNMGMFEGQRVELIQGEIITMAPQNNPHALAVAIITGWLVRGLGEQFTVRCQLPLVASDDTEPEPDRIDFLTHQAASPSSRTTIVISEKGFSMREDRPRARAENRFITRFLPT